MASTMATSTGMYSGRQPAITPLTAMLHTVAARFSGSRRPRTSSGALGDRGGPQHGGRAGPSGADGGGHRVAAVLAQQAGQRRRQLLLVAAVDTAERLELHETDAGIARRERAPDERKHLLVLEEVIPQLADGLAAEVGGARGERSRRRGGGGERPYYVVDGLGSVHGPTLYHAGPDT